VALRCSVRLRQYREPPLIQRGSGSGPLARFLTPG
jgi:hypothetical protein